MCYNVAYLERRGEKYSERYKDIVHDVYKAADEIEDTSPSYFISGFTYPKLPLVSYGRITYPHWGLIPSVIANEESAKTIRRKMLNARNDSVFSKSIYRNIIKTKRGILGVSGFYEWRHFGTKKYPYFIKAKGEELTSLGCIFDTWLNKTTGELVHTFAIITTEANPLMETIHNSAKRMPLILNREAEKEWVDPDLPDDHIVSLMKPFDENKMDAYPVSQMVNSARNNRNVPEAIQRVDYPEFS